MLTNTTNRLFIVIAVFFMMQGLGHAQRYQRVTNNLYNKSSVRPQRSGKGINGWSQGALKRLNVKKSHRKGKTYLRRGQNFSDKADVAGYKWIKGYNRKSNGKKSYVRSHLRSDPNAPQAFEVMAGSDLNGAAADLAHLANTTQKPAAATFNGIALVAKPGMSADAVYSKFVQRREGKRYWKKPGPKTNKIKEQKAARKKARQDKLIGESNGTQIAFKDPAKWMSLVEKNSDPYGSATVRYAERWGKMMQRAIDKAGPKADVVKVLKKHANKLSHIADTEGISGAMHGFATGALIHTWKHGDALQQALGR